MLWIGLGLLGLVVVWAAQTFQACLPPFALIFAYFFMVLIVSLRRASLFKDFLLASAFVFLSLSIAELYLFIDSPFSSATNKGKFIREDPQLGYSVWPGERQVSSTKRSKDGVEIYSTIYTIDKHGLRKTRSGKTDKTVIFFGCSFTFGEGVNDDETLPQKFSETTGMHALNLGFLGYGPHQMLRMLELDRVKSITGINPTLIVYITLPQHIWRAAGWARWDKFGPRYEVVHGQAKYFGSWNGRGHGILERILLKSWIYGSLRNYGNYDTENEIARQRYISIIERSAEISSERYNAPFVVVLWDTHLGNDTRRANANWIAQQLAEKHIPLIRLSLAIPALEDDQYYLGAEDRHPNGKAYAAVAEALASFATTCLHDPAVTPRCWRQ
jgi:hypothetical protein